MITAIDTSILVDVMTANPNYVEKSRAALNQAFLEGSLVVCPVVWAEIRALFERPDHLDALLTNAGIRFDPFDQEVCDLAGGIWRQYRSRGGKRTRLLPDFLVGAHAQVRANRLLSRDRGFYRRYFRRLTVLEP